MKKLTKMRPTQAVHSKVKNNCPASVGQRRKSKNKKNTELATFTQMSQLNQLTY